jgi:hypothetical protein
MDSRAVEYLDRSEGQRVRNRRAPGGACSGRCDVVGGFRIGRGVDDAPQAETVAVELARRCCGVQVMDSHPLWRPSTVSVVLDAASVVSVSVSGSWPQRRPRPFTAVCTYSALVALFSRFFFFFTSINIFCFQQKGKDR